jgi:mannitol/fructose-specific phosphotransferase system IIA component (Ntr-type)
MTTRPAVSPHAWPLATFPLDPASVTLDLAATDGADAIRELHRKLGASRAVRDSAQLLEALLERHALGSSCIDAEFAIPHARTVVLDDFVWAIGRSPGGIRFDDDHRSVRVVVLIAAPAAAVQEYLQCTVGVARRLRNLPVRRRLLDAPTAAEFAAIWNSATIG